MTKINVTINKKQGKNHLKDDIPKPNGIDNIEDIFMPFCDGNFEFELRLLAESQRIYEPELLNGIATNNMGFDKN